MRFWRWSFNERGMEYPQRCIERPLRMVFVRDRCAEECENAVAGGLHEIAIIALGRLDHDFGAGVNDRARLLGIKIPRARSPLKRR